MLAVLLGAEALDALSTEVTAAAQFHRLHLHLGSHWARHESGELVLAGLLGGGGGRLVLALHLVKTFLAFLLLGGQSSQLTEFLWGDTTVTMHHSCFLQTGYRVRLVRLCLTKIQTALTVRANRRCSVLFLLLGRMRTFLRV